MKQIEILGINIGKSYRITVKYISLDKFYRMSYSLKELKNKIDCNNIKTFLLDIDMLLNAIEVKKMKLFVGLGNPGSKYERTRHNAGFMAIDKLSKEWNIDLAEEKKFKGQIGRGVVKGEKVILLKPTTFMNLSGESVRAVMDFYDVEVEDIIVIYDDLDLPHGKIRLRLKGSAGGHNGIKSLIAHLKTQEFKRIRVGIDRHPKIPVVDYVLGKFTEDELALVNQAIDLTAGACTLALTDSFNKVMTEYSK